MTKNNDKGFEYEIDNTDPMGTFLEVYPTDRRGKRGELQLSVFVNTPEGETIEAALKAAHDELHDPVEASQIGLKAEELARQREALAWLIEAYDSVQDFKNSI